MKEGGRKTTCTLYLVRHAETEMNRAGMLMGCGNDSSLTANGIASAEKTAGELKDVPFAAIFSSDAGRAVKTAEIMRLGRPIPIRIAKELRERDFGPFENKPYDEYLAVVRERFGINREKLHDLPEDERLAARLADGVETDEEVLERFFGSLRKIAAEYAGKQVLIVSHSNAMRTFLVRCGYASYEELPSGSFSHAGYAQVSCDGKRFAVEKVKGIAKTAR